MHRTGGRKWLGIPASWHAGVSARPSLDGSQASVDPEAANGGSQGGIAPGSPLPKPSVRHQPCGREGCAHCIIFNIHVRQHAAWPVPITQLHCTHAVALAHLLIHVGAQISGAAFQLTPFGSASCRRLGWSRCEGSPLHLNAALVCIPRISPSVPFSTDVTTCEGCKTRHC